MRLFFLIFQMRDDRHVVRYNKKTWSARQQMTDEEVSDTSLVIGEAYEERNDCVRIIDS